MCKALLRVNPEQPSAFVQGVEGLTFLKNPFNMARIHAKRNIEKKRWLERND
jgi:hypothetical protein